MIPPYSVIFKSVCPEAFIYHLQYLLALTNYIAHRQNIHMLYRFIRLKHITLKVVWCWISKKRKERHSSLYHQKFQEFLKYFMLEFN